jgi:hypothetical protein
MNLRELLGDAYREDMTLELVALVDRAESVGIGLLLGEEV